MAASARVIICTGRISITGRKPCGTLGNAKGEEAER